MATALSCVVDEVPGVHYQMLLLGGAVPVAPYATFGTPELASGRARCVEGHRGADGEPRRGRPRRDLDKAVEASLLLEWGCTVYWRASAIGTPRVLSSEQQAVIAAGRAGLRTRSGGALTGAA